MDDQILEFTVDQSGTLASKRAAEERYVCLWPACETTCTRLFDLKRHVVKHIPKNHRLGFFCPIGGCTKSVDPPVCALFKFDGYWPEPSKKGVEIIDRDTKQWTFLPFTRKDELFRHLQECHMNVNIEDYLEGIGNPVPPVTIRFRLSSRAPLTQFDTVRRWESGELVFYTVEKTLIEPAATS
ncbi:MAG: hypothetical protein M1839_007869 [Geoglossum umbratile]|nr:MAG: hypothetical protein M1839_007869 [Geoglossum umbratile]